jgi:hypothetical protein
MNWEVWWSEVERLFKKEHPERNFGELPLEQYRKHYEDGASPAQALCYIRKNGQVCGKG